LNPARNLNDFRGCRHFQVQLGLDDLAKQEHIPILYMTPILSQVTDDSNGTANSAIPAAMTGSGSVIPLACRTVAT